MLWARKILTMTGKTIERVVLMLYELLYTAHILYSYVSAGSAFLATPESMRIRARLALRRSIMNTPYTYLTHT